MTIETISINLKLINLHKSTGTGRVELAIPGSSVRIATYCATGPVIITCDTSMYTKDHPKFNVSNQKGRIY